MRCCTSFTQQCCGILLFTVVKAHAQLKIGPTSVRRILAREGDSKVDNKTLLFLLKGGHLSMPDRIALGAWPHAPLFYDAIVNYLAAVLEEREAWFPYRCGTSPSRSTCSRGRNNRKARKSSIRLSQ